MNVPTARPSPVLLALFSIAWILPGPASAAIQIALDVNRLEGVAPLAVHFDAGGTTSDATDRPFHTLHFSWDFGDSEAGHWPATGLPRNGASGPVAGHVFRRPGRYPVRLVVIEPGGARASREVMIEVHDPDVVFAGRTYYVSADGDDSHSGNSPQQAFRSVARARHQAGNARILFRRGDTFELTAGLHTVGPGPGLLGAYGEGPAPLLVRVQGSPRNLVWIRHHDWRVEGLRVRGASPEQPGPDHVGIEIGNGVRRSLLLDNEVFHTLTGLGSEDGPGNAELFFVGNHVHDNGNMGAYLSGRRNAYLGNRIERSWASHVLRVVFAEDSVIAHNELLEPSYRRLEQGRLALKLHAQGDHNGPAREATRRVVVSHNTFRGSRVSVVLGPQDEISNHHVHDVLVENNRFLPDVMTQLFLQLIGRDFTVRNNLFLIDRPIQYATFIKAEYWPVVSIPQRRFDLYNNAGIWQVPPTESYHTLTMLHVAPGAEDIRLHNNVLWRGQHATQTAEDVLVHLHDPASLPQLQSSHNVRHPRGSQFARTGISGSTVFLTLAQWQALGKDAHSFRAEPGMVDLIGGDLRLEADSPLIDAGTSVPLRIDYLGLPRPVDGGSGLPSIDIGPMEYQPHSGIFTDGFELFL